MDIQIKHLKGRTDLLQKKFGHPDYRAIYGTGCITQPDICLILMNPTARNVSVHKNWKGLRASWLGTKNIWKLLYQLGLLGEQTFTATQNKRPQDWDDQFARDLYTELAQKKVFLTNLARSTQPDARPLSNSVFAACVPLMEEEINFIRPKVVITFGNQVSSALLKRPIRVSESRKRSFELKIKDSSYPVYATYYPVGMGIMNMGRAVEDIEWILSKHTIKKLPGVSPKRLVELRHATLIASTGASTRLAGSKLSDKEVEKVIRS